MTSYFPLSRRGATVRAVDELRSALAKLDLATIAGLAKRWGVTRQSVHSMAQRPGFPDPLVEVDGTAIYVVPEALEYRDRHR